MEFIKIHKENRLQVNTTNAKVVLFNNTNLIKLNIQGTNTTLEPSL